MKKLICVIAVFFIVLNSSFAFAQSVSAQNTYYVVQAGFYKDATILMESYNLLKAKGFPVYKFAVAGGTRLYVGNYKERKTAESAAKQLEALGFETLILTQKSTAPTLPKTTSLSPASAASLEVSKTMKNEKSQVKNIFIPEDVTIKGIFGSHSLFFFIDENWQLNDNCFFELVFNQSQIKNYKNSTLTVLLNDVPIKSFALSDKDNYQAAEKILLPKDKIVKGYNTIKLSTYHRITEEPCMDYVNPANWLTVCKESYIHIEYEGIPDTFGVNNYPYPYLKVSDDQPVDCIIVVPDNPNNAQITAALTIAADFGKRIPYSNTDIKVECYTDIKSISKDANFIVIGNSSDTENEIFDPIRGTLPDLKNAAIIKEVKLPIDEAKRILYILSDNDEMLLEAARSLTLDNIVLQMKTNTQLISSKIEEEKAAEKNSDIITLKDLGYEDTVIKGIFYQQATFSINLPKNCRLKEDSFINIPLRYTGALDFDKSSVTVYLNNIPLASKLLSEKGAEEDEIKVKIPEELRDSDLLELKVVFYLEPYGFDCKNLRYGEIWALISKDTTFNFPREIAEGRYLEYYPDIFIKNGSLDDTLLVLPDKIDKQYLTMASNIVAFMGHNIKDVKNLSAVKGAELAATDANIIVIGTPKDNAAIKDLNDKLYIKFDGKFEKFESSPKMALIEGYNKNLASIQLTTSPFNGEKHLMVITALKEENLTAAEMYLKDFTFNLKLKGDAAVIDSDGDIYTAYFVKPSQAPKEKTAQSSPTEKTRLQDNPQFVIYLIFFIMLIIISVYVLIIISRSKE